MSEEIPSGAPADPSVDPLLARRAGESPKNPRRLAKNFRWQAFFQRCAEPLFVLDRRLRLLFVNRAWETLTGIPATQAHLLVCRRSRPTTADDSAEDILAHALTPSSEIQHGVSGHIRRLLPGRETGERWWDIDFLPLRQEGEQGGYLLLGRIRPVPRVEPTGSTPMPEKLVNLRQHRVERFSLDAWTSSLPAMRRLTAQVRLASQVTTPVLLVGEAGTGKQTLARTIHYRSPRRDGACAVLDCQRLPPAAVAALLFGERSAGRANLAAIYLREPAYLPRDVQLRLCEMIARSSEAGTEDTTSPRILAGCTTPPEQAVRAGRLLEELACALGTLVLEVPPLRERRADLPALVERLLERASLGREGRITSLSADAWAVVRGYAWPGNVRELYAVLHDASSHRDGDGPPVIRAADLPSALRRAVEREQTPPRAAERALPLEQLLEEAERRLILLALRRTRGHKARAARMLSIPRPRLWRRMLKLGIVDTEEPGDSAADDAKDEE